jgi:predicted PurR-regulated permease PerM
MIVHNQSPFYVKVGFQFLVIFFVCFFINVAQNILIPFVFAILLSVLLLPLVNFLERKNAGRVLSITAGILVSIVFIAGIVYFLSSQISGFLNDAPSIKKHLNDHFVSAQVWVKDKLNISFTEQNQYLNEQADKLKASGTGYLQHTFFLSQRPLCC